MPSRPQLNPNSRRATLAWRTTMTAFLAIPLLLTATSCEGPAAIAYVFTGPSKVPAVHKLDRSKTTLIVVHDPDRHFSNPNAARLIATVAADVLERDAGMNRKRLIDQRDLVATRIQLGEARWKRISMGQLGRVLNAEQVIEATVQSVALGDPASTFRPRVALAVSVWDTNNQVIFPSENDDTQGQFIGTDPRKRTHPLVVQPGTDVPPVGGSRSVLTREQDLAQEAGLQLARLFHAWKPPDTGDRLK